MIAQNPSGETLTVGDLEFELRRSSRRSTVQVTVDRGGELVIAAPDDCPVETMESFVREKRFWIYTKMADKEALLPPVTKKEFVSGEGFPYLGRNYRLLLVEEQDEPVKLARGRFCMRRAAATDGRAEMARWYRRAGGAWIHKRVERLVHRVGSRPTKVSVRELGHRWGSCGADGGVNFHWRATQLSPHLLDYVIVHELVHLVVPHHTQEFWKRVEKVMPDFQRRRQWLAEQAPKDVIW